MPITPHVKRGLVTMDTAVFCPAGYRGVQCETGEEKKTSNDKKMSSDSSIFN